MEVSIAYRLVFLWVLVTVQVTAAHGWVVVIPDTIDPAALKLKKKKKQ